MKILESLIKQQPKQQPKYTHDQVLSWLRWLSRHCAFLSCGDCEYCTVGSKGSCAVTNTYEDIVTTRLKLPIAWDLPRKKLIPERPESLEFLKYLHWSKEGDPVPPKRRKQ